MTQLKEKTKPKQNTLHPTLKKNILSIQNDKIHLFYQLENEEVDFVSYNEAKHVNADIQIVVIKRRDGDYLRSKILPIVMKNPRTPILAISHIKCTALVLDLFRVGVSGFIPIDQLGTGLSNAVDSILTTGTYLGAEYHPALIDKILHHQVHQNTQLFSERELEVLQLMMQGKNVKTMAKELFLSESTVNDYILQLYRGMGVHSKLEAIKKAYQMGIRPPLSVPSK